MLNWRMVLSVRGRHLPSKLTQKWSTVLMFQGTGSHTKFSVRALLKMDVD